MRLRRMGKRICIGLETDIWLVLHLMIAGRLHWKKRDAKLSPPRGLAAFDFENGTLLWTEAGSKNAPPCTWLRAKMGWRRSIRGESRFWMRISISSPRRLLPRIIL